MQTPLRSIAKEAKGTGLLLRDGLDLLLQIRGTVHDVLKQSFSTKAGCRRCKAELQGKKGSLAIAAGLAGSC